ncbi:GNAT family N-acetyltransferase [Subtercola lobariae]|nr:GNAT family N-acetyltransferase [Subtercola lobariae]
MTRRLLLHPYTPAEAERVLAGRPRADDNWAEGYPFADELDILPRFIDDFRANGDPRPFGPYVIRRLTDGAAVGGIGFTGFPDAEGAVEVGYGLVRGARGRGFATEALAALGEVARASGARIIRADTRTDNIASQRVLLRCGFAEASRAEGSVFFERSL